MVKLNITSVKLQLWTEKYHPYQRKNATYSYIYRISGTVCKHLVRTLIKSTYSTFMHTLSSHTYKSLQPVFPPKRTKSWLAAGIKACRWPDWNLLSEQNNMLAIVRLTSPPENQHRIQAFKICFGQRYYALYPITCQREYDAVWPAWGWHVSILPFARRKKKKRKVEGQEQTTSKQHFWSLLLKPPFLLDCN